MFSVYFLYSGAELIYVGRTTALQKRLDWHRRNGRAFDSFTVIEYVNADAARAAEKHFIAELRPTRNTQHASKAKAPCNSAANVAGNLRRLMAQHGHATPSAAARHIGISQQQLCRILHGQQPRIDTIAALANGYGIQPYELLIPQQTN